MVVPSVARGPSSGPLTEQEPAAMLVQPVEDCAAHLEHALVVEHKREPSTDDVEAGGAWLVETVISEVGLVHDPSEIPQHRVLEPEVAQDGLEAAVAAVVGELDPAHVERGGISGYVSGVLDEHELGVGIDEAP
jgi:hypothetical protein